MRRRKLAFYGTLLMVAFVAGGFNSAAKAADVNIDNFTFSPAEITIAVGDKVNWMNRDDIPHTVTDAADPRAFKSPPLDTGDGFAHVFSTPGIYHYFCSLHPHMQGTVVVK